VDEDALNVLSEAGSKATLRYAIQLLAPSAITAKICGRSNVTKEDIRDVGDLFLDAKSSAVMLEKNADKYMV
jgi:RuvB-like protein 1 (pontin 52)